MIQIQIADQIDLSLDTSLLEKAAEQTLSRCTANPQAELTIVLTDEAQIQQLNRQFAGIDTPTDVLSFPQDYIDPDSQAPYLGDVVIAVSVAQAQSEAGGHSLADELRLLVVHGVLHLLGYDHEEVSAKAVMLAAQAEILSALGSQVDGSF